MFTGLIEATGRITAIQQHGQGARVRVESPQLDWHDVKIGDSIAVNGVCLTAVVLHPQGMEVDVSSETLDCTLFGAYAPGQMVNLEKALLPTTRLGGHFVTGHVDGVGTVERIEQSEEDWQLYVTPPKNLVRYIAPKGSITIDGTSLTVNAWHGQAFRLTIIPHTRASTIIGTYRTGQRVHIEVDIIARYLEQLVRPSSDDTMSAEKLRLWGYEDIRRT